jgi:hypothetical protein
VNYSVKIYKNNQSVSVNEADLLNTTSGCSPQFSWLRNRLDVAINNIVTIIGTNFTAVITAQNSSNNVTMFNGMRPQILLPVSAPKPFVMMLNITSMLEETGKKVSNCPEVNLTIKVN